MINIITIMLGLSVGAKAEGATFLDISTLKIIAMGLAWLSVSQQQAEFF